MAHAFAKTLKTFTTASGKEGQFYSLPALARRYPNVGRLPVSLRIVLESVLRNCDGNKVTRRARRAARELDTERRAQRRDPVRRRPRGAAGLHRRAAAGRPGRDAQRGRQDGPGPKRIEPLVPVDLVVDHSVMIDHFGSPKALT
jgi:aconitate hydratase